jgi:hypothetical protein
MNGRQRIQGLPRPAALSLVVAFVGAAFSAPAAAQQVADSSFVPRVARPAYTTTHPRILFDEAHHNFHRANGRYRAFADLVTADGCRVIPNAHAFDAATLAGGDVLVISNALGHENMADSAASHPAFTESECDAVRDWVMAGGALLLIADHAPMGAANEILGRRFGVDMSKGYTIDPPHRDSLSPNPSVLLYTRARGNLRDHPITRGRDSTERVSRVIAFTGQSLRGPGDAQTFMALGDSARDLPIQLGQPITPDTPGAPAAGRAQGLAMRVGKGRVVMLAEAAMLSAQVIRGIAPHPILMGMNRSGIDNQQLALNIVHWLTGLLE